MYTYHGAQVGCAKGCTFCATGTMGLRADLSAGEIAEQVCALKEILRLRDGPREMASQVIFRKRAL